MAEFTLNVFQRKHLLYPFPNGFQFWLGLSIWFDCYFGTKCTVSYPHKSKVSTLGEIQWIKTQESSLGNFLWPFDPGHLMI